MNKLILTLSFSFLLLTSCVSVKKYKLLEADYQKAGEAQRNYEQEHKILQVEIQDMKQKMEKLEAHNRELDSANYKLSQRIMQQVSENWKAKYETLLEAYEKLSPKEKSRGDDAPPKDSEISKQPLNTEKKTKTAPAVVKIDKPYNDIEGAKEVKLPKKDDNAATTKDVKQPDKDENVAVKNVKQPDKDEKTVDTKEAIDSTAKNTKADELNLKIQDLLDKYKLGEEVQKNQNQTQIALSFGDNVLFEEGAALKFSATGEALLNGFVYAFGKFPNLTIDLVNEGLYAEEKAKKIAEFFAQYNIKTRILAKNAIPLAFETSGTQKAVNSLILRME